MIVDCSAPGQPLKKSARVRAGQRLWVGRPIPDPHAHLPEPRVLFEDADLLVLDKPTGLAVHPTASRLRRTVTWWLAGAADPLHRIDVETSGVLVCARGAAVSALKADFATPGRVRKIYRAVVEGHPERSEWQDSTPLGFAGGAVRIKIGRGERPALTRFRVLGHGAQRALIEAQPLTGRQHQIRVHLGLAGHPVVGDKLYGPDERYFLRSLKGPLPAEALERLGHRRHALHAAEIELEWPRGRSRTFRAPWPADLAGLIATSR